ncbi:PAS domain S-box protein [Heliobacterium undosum]|uniref:histidine kinase n=1 Tax=Heliomicrobium undosum TaxID=121734 RepID=A0A845L2E0_9FIRM|nr:MASE3 domain-containing protein [Heliomicrobium undosum]MZP30423.1 PAS domain S-box protein [Heliomicrobium undosum]
MAESQIGAGYAAIVLSAVLITALFLPFWQSHTVIIHAIFELLCVVLALSGFIITWILFEKGKPECHLFGFGFLSVGLFTVFHIGALLGFFSSPIDPPNLAGRYWVTARFVEALVLLIASAGLSFRFHRWAWLFLTLSGTLAVSLAIFLIPDLLPKLFIEEQGGSTATKIFLEMLITGMFFASVVFQLRRAPSRQSGYTRYVILALLLAIPVGALSSVFPSMRSYNGLLLHALKVSYYYFLFQGLFVNMVTSPYRELTMASQRFYKIFHASPASISIVSIQGYRYVDVNEAWVKLTGYSREEVIGRSQQEFGCLSRETHLAIANRPVQNIIGKFTTKNGEAREGMITTEVIELDGVPCLFYVTIDVTEKNRFERELARLDRLNLVGQVAAGIGHEIRNPLTTVRGFLQLFGSKEDLVKYEEYFQLMISELDRANEIITEFLSLAKTKPKRPLFQDLNQIIHNLHPLLMAQAFKKDRHLVTELGAIPPLALDENEIRQLLLNLVNNALDAMKKRGTATIRTYIQGERVVLSVTDQGEGIPKEIQSQIGTPFFTTKAHGTGLGLATCYTIAERHHGRIDFETGPKGTTFFVAFPLAEQEGGNVERAS